MPAGPDQSGALEWVFDPVPPSGAIQGGVPTSHVFQGELKNFVREVLQNSYDEIKGEDPVKVAFTFYRLSGTRKEEFLAAIDWVNLREHLSSATESQTTMARRIAQALTTLSQPSIDILRISDTGTKGLTGGEDQPSENFNALCRNVLDTTEDRPGRGGSHGLGKAVLWSFSSCSTVLFSSRIEDNPQSGFRFFGRTELPFHATVEDRWSGLGWYGKLETLQNGKRAISVWDELAEQFARGTYLARSQEDGTGTSILIIGFREPTQEEQRPLEVVAGEILDVATTWFWPSMLINPVSLQVTAEVIIDGETTFSSQAGSNEEVRPFIIATRATDLVPQACDPGQVSEEILTFNIPATRYSPPQPETQANMRLRLARGDNGGLPVPAFSNRVALVRGSGMVVDYRRTGRIPLDSNPFYGVLSAGSSQGDSAEDIALEKFLRSAEPPAHNDWTITERIQADYQRGARTRLDQLWRDIDNAVVRLCAEETPTTVQGPQQLARLFPIGGLGGPGPGGRKFTVSDVQAHLSNDVWSFSGRIISSQPNTAVWTYTVEFWLDAETGRGDRIPVEELIVDNGETTIADGVGKGIVPSPFQEVSFHGRTTAFTGQDFLDLSLTRVRLEVRARAREDS